MAVEKFVNITEKEIKELGVQALADRPNRKSPYGSGGLSASQLKAWFDNLTKLLAEKINTLQDTFANPQKACNYIAVSVEGWKDLQTLAQLISSMQTGDFLKNILMIDAKNSIAPNGVYPFVYLHDYLSAMVVEYRKLNTDTNDSLGNLVDNDTYTAKVAELEAGLSGKVDNASYVNDNAAVQKALALKVDTTDFEKVKQELNTTDIRLTNIEARFSDDSVIDSTVAYEKAVPANALPYAEVQKVGGMTYTYNASTNLFGGTTYKESYDGMTAVFNKDGTIVLNGTSDWAQFPLLGGDVKGVLTFANPPDDLPDGMLSIHYSAYIAEDDHWDEYDEPLTKDTIVYLGYYDISLVVRGEVNNLTLYPMHNEGSVPLPYEPYFEKLRDTKVTKLVSEGANIADINYNKNDWFFGNNIGTVISNTDNSIEGQGIKGPEPYGPNASNGWLTMRQASTKLKPFKKGDVFSVSFDFEILELPSDYTNSTIRIGCGFAFIGTSGALHKNFDINFASGVQRVSETFEIATEAEANAIPVMRIAFSSLHARVSNIMINYGEVAPYKPYRADAVDTFAISAELRAFLEDKGYGRGVSGYPNYIDFERKVFVQNTYRKVFDGTENWLYGNTTQNSINGYRLALTMSHAPKYESAQERALLVCNLYNTGTAEDTYYCINKTCSCSATGLYLFDKNYTTSDTTAWKAHLAELYASGNPLVIEYAMAEPTEIDISAYLTDDNFIEVEGGGSIKAVNEYEYDAPSTIEYQTEAVE